MKYLLLLTLALGGTFNSYADAPAPAAEELSPADYIPRWWGYWGWGPGVVTYPGYAYGYSFWDYVYVRPLPYGAIAYSRSADKFGYSWGDWNRSSSESRAIYACGQADCVAVVWVQGGCAAAATRLEEGRLGWGYAPDLYRAKSNALTGCSTGAQGRCDVRAWVCSGN